MSLSRRQWLEGFARADGTDLIAFSRLDHDYQTAQALAVPLAPVIGASYAVGLLGDGPAPKRPGVEKVRFTIRGEPGSEVDQQADALRAAVRRYGLGRLVLVVEGYGTPERRWAYARAVSKPGFSWGVHVREYAPVDLEFTRLSDWYAENPTVETLGVGASPATLAVTNAGTTEATDMVIQIASAGLLGYTNPRIDNLTTGEWLQVSRSGATASHRLRIDTGRARVEESLDGGVEWTAVYGSLVMGAAQAGMLTLVPGENVLRITDEGTPDMDVTVTFSAPYE